ncbi:hypothetical protein LIER_33306 [Lithospermum erythrorhizon]|uniref:NAC domain-containing protein n=1 Tax=Lithospermum erythrorhizon TaxID=34254 RepID=A0AAV3RWE5_LITER
MEEEDMMMMGLPPGFRFHPTDEEIITHYLKEKVINNNFIAQAIGEVDLNKSEPWELPKKAKMGEKEWFFFCQRDRKYPTGMRTNRATEAGYWKATGKDKEIFQNKENLIGMKKTLVFYKGRAPKGIKSNWVMHEYRLEGIFSYYNLPRPKDDWVVCRIFHKNTPSRSPTGELIRVDSFVNDLLENPTLPGLMEIPGNDGTPDYSTFMNGDDDEEEESKDPSNEYLLFNNQWTQIMGQDQNQASSSNPRASNSILHPQLAQIPYYQNQERPGTFPGFFPGPVFQSTNQDISQAAIRKHCGLMMSTQCKTEQFSSNDFHSINNRSQDTDFSTDLGGPEVSSVVPESGENTNKGKRPFEELEFLALGSNISDLDSLWDY